MRPLQQTSLRYVGGAALLFASCSEPVATESVAIRPLGGDWSVSETAVCGEALELPTDVPVEVVVWSGYHWTSVYQLGAGDRIPVKSCDPYATVDVNVIGVDEQLVRVSGSNGAVRDVIATTNEVPPRYIIKRNVDRDDRVTLDFARDGATLEAREVTLPDATTASVSTVITTALGGIHYIEGSRFPVVAWTLPDEALATGERQEVEVRVPLPAGTPEERDNEWTNTFDLRVVPQGPLVVTAPPALDDAHWSSGGVTVTTAGTFDEWSITDHEFLYCEYDCYESHWALTKTPGWPGTITGTSEVAYPDVTSIPGFTGWRPIAANARVETKLTLCTNENGVRRCHFRDASK